MSRMSDPMRRAYRDPRSLVVFSVTALSLLATDLAVKSLSFAHVAGSTVTLTRGSAGHADTIPPHEPVVLVPYVLSLKLTTNIGAVFGLGKGGQWLFVAVSVVAVGAIFHFFGRSRAGAVILHMALAMVLAGALGNLYDRVMYHAVRDMLWLFPDIKLPFGLTWFGGSDGLYPWIFNVADAALVVGVGVLIVVTWRTELPQPPKNARQ